jgi:hypothetical protein
VAKKVLWRNSIHSICTYQKVLEILEESASEWDSTSKDQNSSGHDDAGGEFGNI